MTVENICYNDAMLY